MKLLRVSAAQQRVVGVIAIATAILLPSAAMALIPAPLVSPSATVRPGPALVDDSATVVLDPVPKMNWRNLSPKSGDNAIVGKTQVNVKLATAAWLGKRGKIYMVMPAATQGAVSLSWRGTGQLLSGQLKSGARALVFNGVIRSPRIEDVLSIEIEADGTRISQTQQLQVYYEIEVE